MTPARSEPQADADEAAQSWRRPVARRLRLPLHALLAAVLSLALSLSGLFGRLETAVSDVLKFSKAKVPSGDIALVVADATTIQRTGRYPYDRRLLARTLDRLREAGAERIYLDAALNAPEDPGGDAALAEALERLGPGRVALPVVQNALLLRLKAAFRPLEIFGRHATLVGSDFLIDGDRKVRRIAALSEADPMTCDWILGREKARTQALAVDLAYDAARLPRFEMSEVAEGRFDPQTFRNRRVFLGLEIPSAALTVMTPQQGIIGRMAFLALGAETLASGAELAPLSPLACLSILFCLALLTAAVTTRAGAVGGLVVVVLVSAAWFSGLHALQAATHFSLPTASVALALGIVWQSLLYRESRLAVAVRRRLTRVFGVGREALETAVEAISEPAVVLTASGAIVARNSGFEALMAEAYERTATGWPRRLEDLGVAGDVPRKGFAGLRRLEVEARKGSATRHLEARLRWVDTLSAPLALALFADVTEVRRQIGALQDLAYRDEMTKLLNRRGFDKALADLDAKPGYEAVALLLVDLDGFKQINDTLGHHAGDAILKSFAALVARKKGPQDLAARLGGDEFAVALPGGDLEAGRALARELLEGVKTPVEIDGAAASYGASIGVVARERSGEPMEALVRRADEAMYEIKRQRKRARAA